MLALNLFNRPTIKPPGSNAGHSLQQYISQTVEGNPRVFGESIQLSIGHKRCHLGVFSMAKSVTCCAGWLVTRKQGSQKIHHVYDRPTSTIRPAAEDKSQEKCKNILSSANEEIFSGSDSAKVYLNLCQHQTNSRFFHLLWQLNHTRRCPYFLIGCWLNTRAKLESQRHGFVRSHEKATPAWSNVKCFVELMTKLFVAQLRGTVSSTALSVFSI